MGKQRDEGKRRADMEERSGGGVRAKDKQRGWVGGGEFVAGSRERKEGEVEKL